MSGQQRALHARGVSRTSPGASVTMQRDGEAAEARRGRIHFWNACTHAAGTGSRAIDCRWMISSACRNGGTALRCTPASCVCRASRGTRYGLRLQRSGASCTACGAGGAFASRRLGRPRSCLQIRWPRVMRIPDDTDHRTPGGSCVAVRDREVAAAGSLCQLQRKGGSGGYGGCRVGTQVDRLRVGDENS